MFEAVQLVGANEVHLTSKRSLVPLGAKIVSISGNFRCEYGCVIVAIDLGWKLPCAHGESRRRTKRRVAVRARKDDTSLREFVEVRCFDDRVWVVHLEEGCGHLIRHNIQDVWFHRLRRILTKPRCDLPRLFEKKI